MIIEQMRTAKNNKDIVSIYSNYEDTEKFSVGRVLAVNDDDTVLYAYSPYGRYDGYLLKKTDSIFLIETGGSYLEKIAILSDKNCDDFKKEIRKFESSDLVNELLNFAQENSLIVSIELLDSGITDVQGFVDKSENESVIINAVDDYGYSDGTSAVNFRDITFISCDAEDERALKTLYEARQKNDC